MIVGVTLGPVPFDVVSAEERLCMEWFLSKTTYKLPGVFRMASWKTLLPQASLSEPAVLHAVLTLGSVHKRQALDLGTSPGSNQADTTEMFTLQQYTRATSNLRRRIENKSVHSTKVALIACALFVHLELLRGCYQTALTHLRHGLLLLDEMLHDHANPDQISRDLVGEWILQTFTSLCLPARLFGQGVCQYGLPFLLSNRVLPVGETFQSLGHGRQGLEHSLLRVLDLVSRFQGQGCWNSPLHLELEDARAGIQLELDIWLRGYETAMTSSVEKTRPRDPFAAADRLAWNILHLYHSLACAMLAGCFSSAASAPTTSDADDDLTPLFRSILEQCENLFKLAFGPWFHSSQTQSPPVHGDKSNAIADIGWVAPL